MSKRVKRDGKTESPRVIRDKGNIKPTRYFSSKQETAVANAFGGKRQPNSGATMFAKGDVTTEDFLIECKTKTSPSESISIKKEWIEKNEKEALFIGKPYCAIAFNFGPNEKNYYVINEELFGILIGKICGRYNDGGI